MTARLFLIVLGLAVPAAGAPSRPWESAVRIEVDDAGGESRSTFAGVVIDGTPGRGIVLTCAHPFAGGETSARLTPFRWSDDGRAIGPAVAPLPGRLVASDRRRDLALVAFAPGRPLPAATLVARGYEPPDGLACVSLGCEASAPSTWATRVVGRCVGAGAHAGGRWIVADRRSVPGRSGGGLFRASDGALVGVCNFGTTGDLPPAGFYAHPEGIRAILDGTGAAAGGPRP